MKKTITFSRLNFLCFVVGMIGVWESTHSFWALWWVFVASLHFSVSYYEEVEQDEKVVKN